MKYSFIMNAQSRNPNRPSLTKVCECGSGKLRQKCCGCGGGTGILTRDNVAFCLPTSSGGGQYLVDIEVTSG